MKAILVRSFRLPVLVLATILTALSSRAATITVTDAANAGGSCPGPLCTLRQAIAAAKSGDTIDFASTIKKIVLTTGELTIDTKDLTIAGSFPPVLIQRSTAAGTPQFRLIEISGAATVAISRMDFDNGHATSGGCLRNNGSNVNISLCGFFNSSADFQGGAVFSVGAAAKTSIMGCLFLDNTAVFSGAGVDNQGPGAELTMVNCTLIGNNATGQASQGGGIHNSGSATVTSNTITLNFAGSGGGIFNDANGVFGLRNTIVAKNHGNTPNSAPDIANTFASQGFNLIGDGSFATMNPQTGDQIGTAAAPIDAKLNGVDDDGGAEPTCHLLPGSPAIDAGNASGLSTDARGQNRPSDFFSIPNASGGDGSDIGAFEVQDPCASINHVVKNNHDSGVDSLRDVIAQVCAGSTITFDQSLFFSGPIELTSGELAINKTLTIQGLGADRLAVQRGANSADSRILNVSGNAEVRINGLTIANGKSSSGFGGGILNTATLYLSDDAITGNSAVFGGGGIHNNGGTMSLRNCTVSGNITNNGSGGILNSGTLSFNRSTLSGNVAQNGNGGGLVNTGTATITRSTIANNSATGAGGGIHGPSGTINMGDTIVALNTAPSGPDFNAILTSQGFNLIGEHDGLLFAKGFASDKIGVTAAQLKLDVLQNNGGPTMTHALLAGSVAIDAGFASGGTTDQRGLPRPVDVANVPNATGSDGSDIGAFELQSAMVTPTPTPGPTATPSPTPLPPGILGNISTRLHVGTGDNALFAGFIIAGNVPKKVLIRSAGPSLGQFGVPGTLGNPTLELHNANSTIATNDDWQTTQIGGVISADQTADIQNSGAAPTDGAEPAIIATLPPGSYSAIVQGAGGTEGVATVELYDLTPNNGSTFANISTRGLVQTGDNVLIGGFIVTTQPVNLLIRATGPSLTPFGISNALPNPQLDLYDANGTLAANDDWQTTEVGGLINIDQAGYIESTGLAPGDPAESALIAQLAPGNYTAIAQGVNGNSGIGLIEIFTIPLD